MIHPQLDVSKPLCVHPQGGGRDGSRPYPLMLRPLRLKISLNHVFVKLILNLKPKSNPTFQNFSATLPNFQISRSSKSRGFYGQKIAVFASCYYTTTYNHTGLPPLGEGGVGPSRKALLALQRGCYCIATAVPLQHDGVPVATPRGPRCSTKPSFWSKNSNQKLADFCKI